MKTQDVVAVDVETAADGKLLLVGYQKATGDYGASFPALTPSSQIVMHNAKFDLDVLNRNGWDMKHLRVWDTMLMAKVLYEHLPSYGLKQLMWSYLGDVHLPKQEIEEWFTKHGHPRNGADMGLLPRDMLVRYNMKDCEGTLLLFWMFYEGIRREGLMKSCLIEHAVLNPVRRMEHNSLLIDRPWVKKQVEALDTKLKSLIKKGKRLANDPDFNISSIPQLTAIIEESGIILPRSDKGNIQFDKRIRQGVDHPLAALKSEIAETAKLKATYYDNLLRATENQTTVYPNFQISEAATRRFSSRGIGDIKLNWQNFPQAARRAVIVPKGRIGWWFDYKGIENVLHIFFSGDRVRRKAYESDPNWSEYLWLGEKLLGERITKDHPKYRMIKSTKLGMNYGMGARKFAAYHNLPLGEAQAMFRRITDACPAINQLQRKVAAQLSKRGYVQDPFGYRYHGSPDKAYKVVAYMIQGCAAALMKCALVRVDQIKGVLIHNVVHDDLFVTTPQEGAKRLARQVRDAMIDFSDLFDGIPLRVECCMSTTSWGDKKEISL